ncbi:MAG: hypothetical protein OXI39_00995 [Gemmatimonadota bacterium]|uniref:hypothetical protein n=1 Tax=Candidatus Palauibacter scopulicola TaxID=3056741 RepID=UPI00239A90AE|nr:hypothetical protein [Candidatus Palauibacter scopulicola]MDE2661569.1 hypothetical protein [Candidatus Palauibacter scopulicola]
MGIFRKLFKGLGFLIFLLILLIVGWIFRGDIEAWLANAGADEIVVAESTPEFGPEAAAEVETALQELAAGGGVAETRFTETELQSYVRYELVPRLPAGVGEPAVELRDSTVAFTLMLDFTQLPIEADMAASLTRMLGDSARVAGEVLPQVGERGEGRLHVVGLQAGIIPVPPMMLGLAAQQLGLRADGRTVLFDIPETVVDVRVENEEVVLLMDR